MDNPSTLFLNLAALSLGSVLGALVLWPMAKWVGRIPRASFGNSFIVCLLSSSVVLGIWYGLGEDALRFGIGGLLLLNVGLLAATYIPIGKMIWRTSWVGSLKANTIWLLLAGGLTGYVLSRLSPVL